MPILSAIKAKKVAKRSRKSLIQKQLILKFNNIWYFSCSGLQLQVCIIFNRFFNTLIDGSQIRIRPSKEKISQQGKTHLKKDFFSVVGPLRFYPPYPWWSMPLFFIFFSLIIAWIGFWQFFLFLHNFWAKTAEFFA